MGFFRNATLTNEQETLSAIPGLQSPIVSKFRHLAGPGGPGVGLRSASVESIDLRDWNGLNLNGTHDNSSILQAAIDQASFGARADLGYGTSYQIKAPSGRIAFSSTLLLKKQTWIEGTSATSGGTEFWFVDSAGQANAASHALSTYDYGDGLGTSYMRLLNFRIEDKRTASTGGRGINLLDCDNGVLLFKLQVMQFPFEQIYVGAPSGYAGDCTEIHDVWVTATAATKPYAKGILIERMDNFVTISHVKSDIWTTPTNDGYVIRVRNIPNDRTVVHISNVKHESMNRCPTLSFPFTTRGNLHISDITQQQPGSGGMADAGDIIQFGAYAGAHTYAPDGAGLDELGVARGWTTGSTSETGGRCCIENVSGESHWDWANNGSASAAATIRMLGTGTSVYGPVVRATIGNSGRVTRDLTGSGSPEASVYGNCGDTFRRVDATTGTPTFFVKRTSATNALNTGWWPVDIEDTYTWGSKPVAGTFTYRNIRVSDYGDFLARSNGTSWVPVEPVSIPALRIAGITKAPATIKSEIGIWPMDVQEEFAWASIPAASTYTGRYIRITDYGNSLWRSDGTNWIPVHPVTIGFLQGLTGVAGTTLQTVGTAITLPAGMLTSATQRIVISVGYGKSGTTDAVTAASIRCGTTGTIADASLTPVIALTAGSRSVGASFEFFRSGPTGLKPLGGASNGGGYSGVVTSNVGGTQISALPAFSTAPALFCLGVQMAGSTDTPQLHSLSVVLHP